MNKNVKNEMKMEFDSKSNNEAFARISVAIIHAYPDRTGTVKIKAKLYEDEIEIEVSDNGEGIQNVDEAREPLFTTRCNLERSGMGFTIMENFMDSLKVESIVGLGTKITMTKKIKKVHN